MQTSFLPFHIPDIGEDEIQAVVETLRSGWLTTGPKVRQFEEDFARYIGCRHAVAVNSATSALHLALEAVGIKAGDEVLVPTLTFAATAAVVLHLQAKPKLVDCRPETLNLDPDQLERAITAKTRAIIPVHMTGLPCEMGRILEIAKAHNLRVIEDAAHALPARFQEQRVGTIGDITCFSFYATKTITTGEGGMATTENPEWAERMRIMGLHGISKDAWKRYTAEGSWYYEILSPGYKYNLTDLAAAIGIQQLKKCDQFWQARQRIAALYTEGFQDMPEITTPALAREGQHAWHLYILQLNLERLRISRNEFVELLKQYQIGTSVHFIPLHLHPYYRETFGYRPQDLPQASAAFERIVSLPLYPKMTEAQVQQVISAVREIVRQHRR
ncbi:MAG: DegT/DnrJ/EryC1/StrS family aminotransferase [Deltaproteobacteria bacterium]|nr:MAG: DegT/DnrJ/EryC1/StrS family aminotransferase [Deltaproteobacteria bacterium]